MSAPTTKSAAGTVVAGDTLSRTSYPVPLPWPILMILNAGAVVFGLVSIWMTCRKWPASADGIAVGIRIWACMVVGIPSSIILLFMTLGLIFFDQRMRFSLRLTALATSAVGAVVNLAAPVLLVAQVPP